MLICGCLYFSSEKVEVEHGQFGVVGIPEVIGVAEPAVNLLFWSLNRSLVEVFA